MVPLVSIGLILMFAEISVEIEEHNRGNDFNQLLLFLFFVDPTLECCLLQELDLLGNIVDAGEHLVVLLAQ